MTHDGTWDFRDPASKGRLVAVARRESDELFALVSDPARWNAPTACTGWEVRDMVGHLVDATESTLAGFDIARRRAPAPTPVGTAGMAKATDEAARAFRSVPRDELLAQFRHRTDRVMDELDSLSDAEWSGLMVADRYMGPLPAMIVAVAGLGGYTVHGWDVRQGLGAPHAIAGDAADLLVPFVFILWSATADTARVDSPFAIGIRTTGNNAGDTRFDVSETGVRFAPGNVDECPAIFECDPATLVLTAYGRINSGTIRGDRQLIAKFRSLFVAI